jgi:hypothetical protein
VQGRISTIINSLRSLEESDRRIALERRRIEIMEMRATGVVEVAEPDGGEDADMEEERGEEDETIYE